MQTARNRIDNMQKLRFDVEEKYHDFMEDVSNHTNQKKFNAAVKFGTIMVNACKTEVANNALHGIKRSIDFLEYGQKEIHPPLKQHFLDGK